MNEAEAGNAPESVPRLVQHVIVRKVGFILRLLFPVSCFMR